MALKKSEGTSNEGSHVCAQKQDLTGKRFGSLTVLELTENRRRGSRMWRCQCDCGNICEKPTGELNSGFATSCGCRWRQSTIRKGDRYGRLIAIQPTERRSAGSVIWECLCDCGNTVFVRATMLTSNHTTSCGCVKQDIDKQRDFKNILTYTNDTCLEFARDISKLRSNTSRDTGVRGVILKDGKYEAHIVFQRKHYYLGRFSRLEDAIEIRKRAEARVEEYVEEYLSGNPSPTIRLNRSDL